MEDQMTAPSTVWALGDYHRFAKQMMWSVGPELVEACEIVSGQNVLDVAAGTGNVAIRAAEAGANVVASDLTPESLAAGEREARERGLDIEWVVADAQALPFADGEFDVVTSAFGAMFAPDHQAVANELLRVCRPGGTIGLANFTPEGGVGEFFGVFAPYLPAPPHGAQPPVLWGDEAHVWKLFGDGVNSLELTRAWLVERSEGGPREYCDFYRETFGAGGRRVLRRAEQRRPARPRVPRLCDADEPRRAERPVPVPLRVSGRGGPDLGPSTLRLHQRWRARRSR